jgi:hypothetical protein
MPVGDKGRKEAEMQGLGVDPLVLGVALCHHMSLVFPIRIPRSSDNRLMAWGVLGAGPLIQPVQPLDCVMQADPGPTISPSRNKVGKFIQHDPKSNMHTAIDKIG